MLRTPTISQPNWVLHQGFVVSIIPSHTKDTPISSRQLLDVAVAGLVPCRTLVSFVVQSRGYQCRGGFLSPVPGWGGWVAALGISDWVLLEGPVCESTSGYLRSRKISLEQSNRAGLKICYLQIILGFSHFLYDNDPSKLRACFQLH